MNRPMMALTILLVSACSYASLDMERGVGINASNKDDLWSTSIPYAVARQGLRSVADNEYIVGFQDLGDYVIGLSNAPRLMKVQSSDRSVLGSWVLTRWESDYIEDEVLNTFYHGRQWPGTQDYHGDLTGCLSKSPLHSGDFTGNGALEFVMFLPDEFTLDMLVFSPEKEKIIFSHPVATTNSIAQGEADQNLLHPDVSRHYQYYVRSGQEIVGMGWAMKPAVRAYGKVYPGDFNENGALDLLVWRKLFQSRLASDQVSGFERLRETWMHYAMVDGEYQTQDTPEATIRSWLAANNLTWQSGFPSQSECPGEEGQLIPEMHDPLLNDPDVLQ